MVGLFYEKVGVTKGRITSINNYPEKLSPEDKQKNYLEVDFVPEPERISGKMAVLYVNLENNTIYYEYIDKPVPDEIQRLNEENLEIKLALAELAELIAGGEG